MIWLRLGGRFTARSLHAAASSHDTHQMNHSVFTVTSGVAMRRLSFNAGDARSSRTSSVNALRPKHRELPRVGPLIVANEIGITVRAFQLEIAVVWRQPGVEYLYDCYPTVTQNQGAWRLLAAVPGVALDPDAEQPLFRAVHLLHFASPSHSGHRLWMYSSHPSRCPSA